MTDAILVEWLLDSDPALRWRVERDLLRAPRRSGRRPVRGSRPRASALGCSPCRTPTGSGQAARSSRPTSTTKAGPRGRTVRGSRGPRRPGR
ncbi:hypothetical protein NKG05_12275 [Oerskovia sp. M15]